MNQERLFYRVTQEKSVVKSLKKVPKMYSPAIQELMCHLEVDPLNASQKSLSGVHNGYIKRIGDWRIIYIVDPKNRTVNLVKMEQRKNVYK
ncbi:hypothetical protein TNIN_486681 [Trichonephila inaurata madagascariensis]|uniref:Type II toxin-antitoxin system RelE/ParE family toxin n=1 Tax=Trichonephila inaurata madagascariensis TaxID=2747483 RepID=A0A8X6XHW4_9ARAC|nr:hypothetical protein TNIN_486681 [Trichonephila inaurata madagascariensis]